MLRWSDEQHAAWKARQAREYADQRAAEASDSHAVTPGRRTDTLTLPWPPTGNTSVRHGNGSHYLTQDVRDYRAAVGVICRDYAPIKGRYRLHVHLSPPDKRRRDADNACKQLLDALVLAGYVQDDAMAYMRELVVTVDDEPCYGWAKVRAVPMEVA
jgi:crossover junction endodeoxyribonuclease RusA